MEEKYVAPSTTTRCKQKRGGENTHNDNEHIRHDFPLAAQRRRPIIVHDTYLSLYLGHLKIRDNFRFS